MGRLPREPYRRLFRQALSLPPKDRLFFLEAQLDRLFWEQVRDRIDDLPRFDRAAAEEILGLRADLERFNLVHRGWRAGLGETLLQMGLPPLGTVYQERMVRRALAKEDAGSALRHLFPLPITGDPLSLNGELALARRLFRHLRRILRSHPFDISISLAAVLLKELESRDLLTTVEGLRFSRTREEIVPLLAGSGG
jgi:V/A-type H+-transporting ATPase subunit C